MAQRTRNVLLSAITFILVVTFLSKANIVQAALDTSEISQYFTDAAPVNLKVKTITSSSQKICWNALPSADGYYVYYSTKKNGNYSCIGYTSATSIRNLDLKTGVVYYYKIQAYRIISGTYYYSRISEITAKTAGYPKTPSMSIQKVNKQGKKVVVIRWSNISDAKYIQLYRKKEGQGFKKILDKKIAKAIKNGVTVSYVKTNGTMSFKVRTYNKADGIRYYSGFSNEKKVKLG